MNTNRIVEDLSVHPVNMALARAIVGDKSDNLPGVPNVGFGRVNKFFPFLKEEEEYSVRDLIKVTEELATENKSKFLKSILDHFLDNREKPPQGCTNRLLSKATLVRSLSLLSSGQDLLHFMEIIRSNCGSVSLR